MTYESTLFERNLWELALSQRFKHAWCKFNGSFSLASQLLISNYTIGCFPSEFAFFLLPIYLTLLSILSFLIIRNLTGDHRNTTNEEDLDMICVIKRKKYMKRNFYKVLFLFLMWAFILSILFTKAIWPRINETSIKPFDGF